MHTVTVYSNWEQSKEYEFETLEEAYHFAEEMRHQQYRVIIDEAEEEEPWYNKDMNDLDFTPIAILLMFFMLIILGGLITSIISNIF